jgi:multimeric flavodoxin WrbA
MYMLRIVSFAGSFTGEKSHTKRASDMLADAVTRKAAEEGIEVSYECITADQLRIEHCRGCTSCFKKGICPLDKTDDMPMLKHKILEADAFFLCTPVYLWEMSGITKTVIDRITYWSHRFELAGKACVTIASTDNSIESGLSERLKQYLSFMGASVVDGITAMNYSYPNINREDEIDPVMDAAAEKLIAAWKDPAAFITDTQEKLWAGRVKIIKRSRFMKELIGIDLWDEIKVCEERKVADYGSYAEYVTKTKIGETDEI